MLKLAQRKCYFVGKKGMRYVDREKLKYVWYIIYTNYMNYTIYMNLSASYFFKNNEETYVQNKKRTAWIHTD